MTNKDDFIKKVLIAMFIFLSIFTLAMIVIFLTTGNTPDTLIVAVFGACMGEYSICGLIKNAKEKEKTERLKEGFVDEDEENPESILKKWFSTTHEGNSDEEAID